MQLRNFTLCLLAVLCLALFAPSTSLSQVSFTKHTIDSNLSGAYWVYVADVDRDGKVDLVTASTGQGLNWYKNGGSGSFSKRTVGGFTGAWNAFAKDVDGDGDIDILGASPSLNEIAWWENNGSESFSKHSLATDFLSAESVSAADLDGDGDTDIVGAAWGSNQVWWWENRGGRSFTKHVLDSNLSGAHSVVTADVNRDGKFDVVASGATATTWYQSNGGGSFSKRYVDSGDGGLGVFGIDMDGDRDIDVLRATRSTEAIDWLRNNGSGGFSRTTISPSFGNAWSVGGGDVDGDGDIDVVSGGIYNNTVMLWRNDGGRFTEQVVDDNFAGIRAVFVADFDRDGDDDIVAVSRDLSDIAWWEASGSVIKPVAKSITVVSPNGGESWTVGSTQHVTWTTEGSIAEVDIAYSTDGGSTWTNVVSQTTNDGDYNWGIPNNPSGTVVVRISDASAGATADVSDANFSIVVEPTTGPSITLTSPNGGEWWAPGSSQFVRWTSGGDISNVRLEYSVDGGSTWSTIVSSTLNDGEYSWTVPVLESVNCLVRVSDTTDPSLSDVSNGPFSITSSQDFVQRVNAGGGSYSSAGKSWSADQRFVPGSWGHDDGRTYATDDPISNTTDDPLYQTERYGMLAYRFTVPANGQYRVDLHFAEIFATEPGQRVFGVSLEGTPVLENFDIFAEVGREVAMVRSFQVDVQDGVLDVEFEKGTNQTKVSAIEVSSSSAIPVDSTPPSISNIILSNITASAATISWQTDEPADGQVEYGIGATYGTSTPLATDLLTTHQVTLTGLSPNTDYHFVLHSRDSNGNLASTTDLTFTTGAPDLTAPSITSVTLSSVTASGATITWTTDEVSDSQVEYGADSTYGNATPRDPNLSTSHKVVLSGLSPQSTYHFRVTSGDGSGNVATSPDHSFTTLKAAAYVQRVNAGGDAYTDAGGNSWSADQLYVTGSWGYDGGKTFDTAAGISNTDDDVLYQTERHSLAGYRFTVPVNGLYEVTLHFAEIFVQGTGQRYFDVNLEGAPVLENFDIYSLVGSNAALVRQFEVDVTDGVLDITFTQLVEEPKISAIEVHALAPDETPPGISNIVVSAIRATSATIAWQTNESAYGQVDYGLDTDYGTSTELTTTLTTSHEVVLVGLSPDTTYHFRVHAVDASGNVATGDAATFRTDTLDITPPAISGVGTAAVGASDASITWQTDEVANSQVEYGPDTTYGATTPSSPELELSHTVVLAGLTPGSTYHYRVKSKDASGNLAVSRDFTFVTSEISAYEQRVNAGGAQYTEGNGKVWDADQEYSNGSWGYIGGRTYDSKHSISNTSDDALFQSERFGMEGYSFTVPQSGRYQVSLLFAEIFHTAPGERIFDVYIEGKLVLEDFDIFALVGHDAALTKTFEVDVSDGVLDVTFVKILDRRKISAIEVKAVPPASPLAKRSAGELNESAFTSVPREFDLSQNYPNPFNAQTRMNLSLPEPGNVSAVIYNIAGREILRLFSGKLTAGNHVLRWDGRGSSGQFVGSGVYFLKVVYLPQTGMKQILTKRMVVLK